MVSDYVTITSWMAHWWQLKSDSAAVLFAEHGMDGPPAEATALLKKHGMVEPRKKMIFNNDTGYRLSDGTIHLNDNWFDPLMLLADGRGDFPLIQIRRGTISLGNGRWPY